MDKNKSPASGVVPQHSVTEQANVREQLRASDLKYRRLFETANVERGQQANDETSDHAC